MPHGVRAPADDRVVARYFGGMPHVDVWDVYASLSGRDPSTLNDEQRRLVAVCVLRQAVNSGGFDSYFRYRGGNSAPDAARALQSLLGQDWADLLKEAMDLLGPEYPIDQADRENLVDARDLDEQFEDLDNRYYALESSTNADARLNEYLSSTPQAMA
jgi:hypothetical protein